MITYFGLGPCIGRDDWKLAQKHPVTGKSAGDLWQLQFLTESVLAKETQFAFPARQTRFESKNRHGVRDQPGAPIKWPYERQLHSFTERRGCRNRYPGAGPGFLNLVAGA